MNPEISGERPHFRPVKPRSDPYRMLLWVSLILGGIWIYSQMKRGAIEPLFLPTPTPTRTVESYTLEGDALFTAGNLEGAIKAYNEAVKIAPDAATLAKLARIQAYSSGMLSTDSQRFERLKEARASIEQALALNPDDVNSIAIHAFVLDWYATNSLVSDQERQSTLNDAEREAARAYNLDLNNAQALAYYSEILVDQQKWSQAENYIRQAAQLDPNSMDVHRVYGYVWESLGQYRLAIEEYQKAAAITPNLTFLYILIGRNFLSLEVHNRALEYFEKAVNINEQIDVQDPVPYIEIAKTYTRDGEFFIAALNGEKALSFDPTNPNTYGQLGSIYTKERNYESAKPAFQCAVRGCTAAENQVAREVLGQDIAVQGLPLTSVTVAYYYAQYGSVLAALSRPNQNYCPEALDVLSEVRTAYPDDVILGSIIQENENICSLVGTAAQP
jgi:tetratricopeptide (TPR) repeat protein